MCYNKTSPEVSSCDMFRLALLVLSVITVASSIECPQEGHYFYPHSSRCAKFYECNHGQLAEQDCFSDFIFNPETLICDFPSNVECEDLPDAVPEGPVGTCPELNGAYVDFLTDASDCTVFYMCNWGKPIKMNCPSGLHFNPTLNVCDWPQNAGCTAGQ